MHERTRTDDSPVALRRAVAKLAMNPQRMVAAVEDYLQKASPAQIKEALGLVPPGIRRALPKRARVRLGVLMRPLAAKAHKTEPPLTRLALVHLFTGYLAAVSFYEREQLR